MARLGKLQLARLAGMAHVGSALVVPDAVSRSLAARGLMEATGRAPNNAENFVVVTAAGYRAIADAIDAGLIDHRPNFAALRGGKDA